MLGYMTIIGIGLIVGSLFWIMFRRTDNPPRDSPHRYDQDKGGIGDD